MTFSSPCCAFLQTFAKDMDFPGTKLLKIANTVAATNEGAIGEFAVRLTWTCASVYSTLIPTARDLLAAF